MVVSVSAAELKIKYTEAEEAYRTAQRAYHDALIAEYPLQPGTLGTLTDRGKTADAKIVKVEVDYDEPRASYITKNKDGEWSARVHRLYSWGPKFVPNGQTEEREP